MALCERLPWFLFVAVAAVAPWLLGGRAENAHWVLGTMAWGVVPLVVLAVFNDWREWRETAEYDQRRGGGRPNPLAAFGKGLLPATPLLILMALMGISLLNPSYAWVDGRLVRQEVVTWLPTVIDPARSGPGIFFLCGLLAAWVSLSNPAALSLSKGRGRSLRKGLLLALLANAMLLCCVGLYFNLTGATEILGKYEPVAGYFFATFYYKNHWAAYALLYCGVAAAFFFRDLPRWLSEARRAGSGALALIGIFFLGLTFPLADTRSGILLLAVFGAVVLAGLWRRMPRGRARKWVAAGAVLVAAAFTALSVNELGRSWERTEGQIERAGSVIGMDNIRLIHGPAVCLEMAGDRPFWGWGYLSYDPLFPVYATDYFRDESGVLRNDMEFAHNDWLQAVAEFGFGGFGLGVVGFAALIFTQRRKDARDARGIFGVGYLWRVGLRADRNGKRTGQSRSLQDDRNGDRTGRRVGLRADRNSERTGWRVGLRADRNDKRTGQSRSLQDHFREVQWIWLGIGLVAVFAWWDFPFSNPAVLVNVVVLGVVSRRS